MGGERYNAQCKWLLLFAVWCRQSNPNALPYQVRMVIGPKLYLSKAPTVGLGVKVQSLENGLPYLLVIAQTQSRQDVDSMLGGPNEAGDEDGSPLQLGPPYGHGSCFKRVNMGLRGCPS